MDSVKKSKKAKRSERSKDVDTSTNKPPWEATQTSNFGTTASGHTKRNAWWASGLVMLVLLMVLGTIIANDTVPAVADESRKSTGKKDDVFSGALPQCPQFEDFNTSGDISRFV